MKRVLILFLLGALLAFSLGNAHRLPKLSENKKTIKVFSIPVEASQEETLHSPKKSLDDIIDRIANKLSLKPILIKAIIQQESGGNPAAIRYESKWESLYSKTIKRQPNENYDTYKMNFHSIGLMQIGYGLHKDFCGLKSYTELYDVETNIFCGSLILARCMEKKSKEDCIKAYNGAGPRAEKYKKEILVRMTQLSSAARDA